MKLLHFDEFRLGVLKGTDRVVDVTAIADSLPHSGPGDRLSALIAHWASLRSRIEQAVSESAGVPLSGVRLRAPVPRPGNIDCMAVNYMEDGTRSEPAPINAFHKAVNCIIGPGDTMVLPDLAASVFEGEAEIALVIGKRASNVPASKAMEHVFGYLNFIDGSARGVVPPNNVFFQMKSRATFAPMGPYLVTADEIADPQNLQVRLWVNGEVKQHYNTSDMAHKIPRCIEWLSSIHDLEPGDIVALGTNHRGLSAFQDGDAIELECEGLGRLSIKVRDELKRTWARETRLEREQKGLEGLTPQLTGKYSTSA
jgi:2-keto-4-pentenoate hydratase/2-oxohepta-3-ene-1,7-dioic acid hydratase in catechol pathway